MGLLTSAGSLARTLGPLFVSFLYAHTGPLLTFPLVNAIVVLSILLLLLLSYNRLVPPPLVLLKG